MFNEGMMRERIQPASCLAPRDFQDLFQQLGIKPVEYRRCVQSGAQRLPLRLRSRHYQEFDIKSRLDASITFCLLDLLQEIPDRVPLVNSTFGNRFAEVRHDRRIALSTHHNGVKVGAFLLEIGVMLFDP